MPSPRNALSIATKFVLSAANGYYLIFYRSRSVHFNTTTVLETKFISRGWSFKIHFSNCVTQCNGLCKKKLKVSQSRKFVFQ